MSTDLRLFINCPTTLDGLVEALQPRMSQPFERASEHDGSTYWATSWNHHVTCVSENRFGLDRCAPSIWNLNNTLEEEYEAYDFILCFYNLNIQWESTPQDYEAARDAWIARAWEQWLLWLREAGATDLIMNRDFGPTLRRWRADDEAVG